MKDFQLRNLQSSFISLNYTSIILHNIPLNLTPTLDVRESATTPIQSGNSDDGSTDTIQLKHRKVSPAEPYLILITISWSVTIIHNRAMHVRIRWSHRNTAPNRSCSYFIPSKWLFERLLSSHEPRIITERVLICPNP